MYPLILFELKSKWGRGFNRFDFIVVVDQLITTTISFLLWVCSYRYTFGRKIIGLRPDALDIIPLR